MAHTMKARERVSSPGRAAVGSTRTGWVSGMNKFQALVAFVRVAECNGFSAAGRKIGLSASAVTKMVARLEDDLGAQLFNRTTRSLALRSEERRGGQELVST